MGGYNSSDDEREEDGADGRGGQQASTPPEYRFLAAGRRSLMEYLMSTSSTGSATGSAAAAAAAGGASASEDGAAEAAVAATVPPVEPVPPPPPVPPAMVGGGSSGSVADSASFERIEHEHANCASSGSSSHSFVPDSFASLGSFLFQRDVSLGGGSSVASSMVSSLSASVLHPHSHPQHHKHTTTRSPSPAIDLHTEAEPSLAGSAFTQIHAEDALPEETLSTASAAAQAPSASAAASSLGFRVLDKGLKALMSPKNFLVAVLVAMNVTWRVQLTVEQRRSGRWESRALGEEGRRVEAEAELARALDRLEEVLGALQGCEAEQAAWRAQRARGVVVGGGEGVRVQLGDGYAPVRRSVQNHSNSNDMQGPNNCVHVAAREAADNNGGEDYCSTTKPAAPKEKQQPQQPQPRRRNNDGHDHSHEEEDNYQQQRRGSSTSANNNAPAEDESPPAFTCFPKGGTAASDPPSLALLDNCFVQMRVQGGPCSEEALQALTEGLGHALHTGQATVQEVVKGTVGLAQGLLGSLEGLVDDAAAAASSLSLDALADVLGVGGAGAWFDDDEE